MNKRSVLEILIYYNIPALATFAIMIGIPLVVAFFFEGISLQKAFIVVMLIYFLLIVIIQSMLTAIDILTKFYDN